MWRLTPGGWRMGAFQGVSESFANRVITTYRTAPAGDAVFPNPMIADDVMAEPMLQEQREAYAAEASCR